MTGIEQDKIAEIEGKLPGIAQGYDSGNLARRYFNDVTLLLREVKVGEAEIVRLHAELDSRDAAIEDYQKQVQQLVVRAEAAETKVVVTLDQQQVDEILSRASDEDAE